MATSQSKYITFAENNAQLGDPVAMELLARRFFEGRGTDQSFQKSYYWSTIALEKGLTYLTHMNQFALNKLSNDERELVGEELKGWLNNSPD